ncbi:zf-TFIIB domain-containing protein [Nocardiopsis alba]|uniref:TFIIB-type zinc ribbon-containing protein n=1 Tax=Nocardiopsis alba TaxID=53437 RepID=UPI00367337BC
MRTFDRQGVHIDRCDGCQGIFLDRGELERIVSAEQRHYGMAPTDPHMPPPADPYAPQGGRRPYPDSPRGYRGYGDSPSPYRGYDDSPRPYRRRRKGFLEQLFD